MQSAYPQDHHRDIGGSRRYAMVGLVWLGLGHWERRERGMNATDNSKQPMVVHDERRVPASTWRLLAILAIVAAFGVFQVVRQHNRQASQQIDLEEAPAELASELNETAPSGRLALMLRRADGPSPALRYAAVDALGNTRGPAASDALWRAFTDCSSPVRQRAMEVLPRVDPERGLRLLLAGAVDEDSWIRDAALTQMATLTQKKGSIVDERAVPTLVRALDDGDSVVRFMAVRVLRKVVGKPWTYKAQAPRAEQARVVRQWKAWWAATSRRQPLPAAFAAYPDVRPIWPERADPAPDFHLTTIDGKSVSLAGQRGHLTLLNFWGTWCSPCRLEIPGLAQLDRDYHGRGLDIIGVALGEPAGAAGLRKWCHEHGVGYAQALARDDITEAYGHVEEVPVSVLIDRQGRVRFRWEGERDAATFRAAVERLLAE